MSYIKLDREREVRIRNKAISQIEKRYKKSFIQIMQEGLAITADEYIFILYVGMKHEDGSLTLEKVEDLVDEYTTMDKVQNAVTEASFEAYGTTEEEATASQEDESPNPQAAE